MEYLIERKQRAKACEWDASHESLAEIIMLCRGGYGPSRYGGEVGEGEVPSAFTITSEGVLHIPLRGSNADIVVRHGEYVVCDSSGVHVMEHTAFRRRWEPDYARWLKIRK